MAGHIVGHPEGDADSGPLERQRILEPLLAPV